MHRRIIGLATALFAALVLFVAASAVAQVTIPAKLSEDSEMCIECHAGQTTGIYQQWGTSKHFRANVGCYECHQAADADADAFDHYGSMISIIVSPQDCAQCHQNEVTQFEESHHSKAALILGSLDNFLADIVEGNWEFYGGSALTVSGCKQCHGGVVEVNEDGSLAPTGWPNTGMGRVNPDGSLGACTACHQRHAFSAEQARRPENCGKCHLGPDHPQMEIYEASKHGIAYRAHEDEHQPRQREVGPRRGLHRRADLRHLPHVGGPHGRRRPGAGDPRRRSAHQLEQPAADVDPPRGLGRQARPREDGRRSAGRTRRAEHGRRSARSATRRPTSATSTSSTTGSSSSTTRSSPSPVLSS